MKNGTSPRRNCASGWFFDWESGGFDPVAGNIFLILSGIDDDAPILENVRGNGRLCAENRIYSRNLTPCARKTMLNAQLNKKFDSLINGNMRIKYSVLFMLNISDSCRRYKVGNLNSSERHE